MGELSNLNNERDALIVKLWLVFRSMSDFLHQNQFNQEDVDLWYYVTKHSSLQKRLEIANRVKEC